MAKRAEPKVRLVLAIKPELHAAVVAAAGQGNVTMTEWCAVAIVKALEENTGRKTTEEERQAGG